jgi:hypothetical protein
LSWPQNQQPEPAKARKDFGEPIALSKAFDATEGVDQMSISAISSTNPLLQAGNLQNLNQQQNTEFQQLAQALQSGNLSGAQQVLSTLTGTTAGSGLQSVQLTQELNQLGSALQSGNLSSARQAYSTIQQNLQSTHSLAAHHHRPHRDTGSQFLTSGFPGSSSSGSLAASNVSQPINLTA